MIIKLFVLLVAAIMMFMVGYIGGSIYGLPFVIAFVLGGLFFGGDGSSPGGTGHAVNPGRQ